MAIHLTGTFDLVISLSGTVDIFEETLDADASALIASMTPAPDATRQMLINDTIVSLKDASIWPKVDELSFRAAHSQQAALLGWKRYKDATVVNAPAFEVDRGFTGNGSTSYLNTNFVPSSDGVNYTLNDASFGVYSRTDSAATMFDIGAFQSSPNRFAMLDIRNSLDRMRINVQTSANVAVDNAVDSLGLYVARRTSSTSLHALRNGSVFSTASSTSSALPGISMFLGGANSDGSLSGPSTRQYAFDFVGAALSEQEQADLFTIVENYMDAVGAGVVG